MKLRPTRILVLLVLGGAAAAFYFAMQPRPQEVDLASAVRGPLRITLTEEGQTRVRDRYVVSAPVDGRVLRIEHEPGDAVSAGSTVLAQFLPSSPTFLDTRALAEARARVTSSEASLERSKVDLDRALAEQKHADSELDRDMRLHRDGLLADDRLEASRLRAETAKEAVRAAESTIGVAEAELARARTSLIQAGAAPASGSSAITLRSPISGVVLQRLRESEAIVPSGEPLLEIANPENLEIVSDMLSTDAVRVTEGDMVLIDQWGGGRTLHGTVRRVEPFGFTKISALGVEEQRVNVIVDFDDVRDAWEALGDGYRVEIGVVIWEKSNVLKVPTSSLFRIGENWAVYGVDEMGLAVRTEIEIGRRNALEAEVLGGLSEGDQVIAYPSDELSEGVEVVARGL